MKMVSRKTLILFSVLIITLLGFYARFKDLGLHFTHFDDAGVPMVLQETMKEGRSDPFIISRSFTYAPAQFLVTRLLIHEDHGYRELLFWGRLPSAVFGCLGLAAFVLFYRMYRSKEDPAVLLALALLAFSWESVIYARHSSNYAFGVSAHVFLLILLLLRLRAAASPKILAATSLSYAFLCACHYQIMFLIPAFYAVVLLHRFRTEGRRLRPFLEESAAGLAALAMIFPMLYAFLRNRLDAGVVNWNKGPSGEFAFQLPAGDLLEKVRYAVLFFADNTFLSFQAMISFLPENHPFLPAVSAAGLLLFFGGIAVMSQSRNEIRKAAGTYTIVVLISWIGLVMLQKITLSPTRHSMILLPLFCIGIAEGLGFLGSYLQGPLRLKTLFPIHFTAALLVALSFFAYFPSVLAERRDPIDEPEILEAIKEYEVDYVFQIGPVRTLHAVENYMRSNFYREGKPYFRVAWISRTDPFNPVKARELAAFLIGNKIIPPAATHDISLGVIYSNEKASGPEFEFSSRTSDEPNTFYMNIIDYYAVPRGNPEGVVLPPEVVRL